VKRLLKFEKRHQPVATRAKFRARLWYSALLAGVVITVALVAGIAGYIYFEPMALIDAFANSAMILAGMGELNSLQTVGGKIFAGLYAIFCGLLIFGVAGLMLAPVFHRLLHNFHVDDDDKKN
jgi:hypothetical protein